MKVVAKLTAIIREAGVMGAPRATAAALLRRFFAWRVFIMAGRELDDSVILPTTPPGFTIHPIDREALPRIQRDMNFDDQRMAILRARLEHRVSGLMATNPEGEVVYMIWWAGGPESYLGEINQAELKAGEIMVLDGICRPDARGNGLHSALFQLCLRQAWEQGFRRAYVMHLSNNRISRKIHEEKSGMKPFRTITRYRLLGKDRFRSKVLSEVPPKGD